MTDACREGPRNVDGAPTSPEGHAPECRTVPTLAPSATDPVEADQVLETLRSMGDETGIGADLLGRLAGRSRRVAPLRIGFVTVTGGRPRTLHVGGFGSMRATEGV